MNKRGGYYFEIALSNFIECHVRWFEDGNWYRPIKHENAPLTWRMPYRNWKAFGWRIWFFIGAVALRAMQFLWRLVFSFEANVRIKSLTSALFQDVRRAGPEPRAFRSPTLSQLTKTHYKLEITVMTVKKVACLVAASLFFATAVFATDLIPGAEDGFTHYGTFEG